MKTEDVMLVSVTVGALLGALMVVLVFQLFGRRKTACPPIELLARKLRSDPGYLDFFFTTLRDCISRGGNPETGARLVFEDMLGVEAPGGRHASAQRSTAYVTTLESGDQQLLRFAQKHLGDAGLLSLAHEQKRLLELAWGVIANAGPSCGRWDMLPSGWQKAAEDWRDSWKSLLQRQARYL